MRPVSARFRSHRAEQGLTLVEMVMAILIMSVMAIGLTGFIGNAADSYMQAATRNQLSAAGRIVIDRLAIELHNSLPESIRVSGVQAGVNSGDQCIEFIPIRAATTYLDAAFRPAAVETGFDVIDLVPAQSGSAGLYAVIYPTSPADLYKDSFSDTETIVPATVTDAVASDGMQQISTPNHRFKRRSAVERVFITSMPVSYCVSGNRMYRYSDYGFHQIQPQASGACAPSCLPAATPNRVLITDQIDNRLLNSNAVGGNRAFDWAPATRQRNGITRIMLHFSSDGEQLTLNHEVMQQVTP